MNSDPAITVSIWVGKNDHRPLDGEEAVWGS